jgi:hypothetical protein
MWRIVIGAVVLGTSLPVQAQPNYDPVQIKAALERYDGRRAECWQRYTAKLLKTATELANCANGGVADSLAAAGYPHMDLIQVMVAEELAVAERVDRKKITPIEARAQVTELMSRISTEIRARNLAAENAATVRAAALAKQQEAAEAQAGRDAQSAAQAQALAQMQAQAAADADAARSIQMLGLAEKLLAPRQYATPRVQATCQWLGPQFVCN